MKESIFKNKIKLSSYNYKRDIKNRVLMSQLSVFEVEVLREILDCTLSFPVHQLAGQLGVSQKKLLPALKKFGQVNLVKIDEDLIFVDKDMRKYYQTQISKFDENFKPNIPYIQTLLNKVPLHELIDWYHISNESDHIFSSIVERFLITPKNYQQYLSHLKFTDKAMHGIMHDLFNSSDLKLNARKIIEKYSLSREQFEECMLSLEYHFVCYLSYMRVKDKWEEIITPFHEWGNYLQFLKESAPKPIEEEKKIKKASSEEFDFLRDIILFLELIEEEVEETNFAPEYRQKILNLLVDLGLIIISKNAVKPSPYLAEWLKLPSSEQALMIYRHGLNQIRKKYQNQYTERDIRELEVSIRDIGNAWIMIDDFIKGLTFGLAGRNSVILQNKGKQWRYVLPEYNEEDIQFIRDFIDVLFNAGIVLMGQYKKVDCFKVSAFGHMILGH